MRLAVRLTTAAAAIVAASAGAAHAASVEIKDAVARVTVVPADRSDVRVEVVRPNAALPLAVRSEGGRVVVDGGLHRRIRGCDALSARPHVRVRGVGRVDYDEMPQVVIHTPRSVSLSASGAVVGAIGRSSSLELSNSGCSAWTIADVAGAAEIHESGAGSIRMGASDRLELHLSGAADVHATRVRNGLDARLSGAGNVQVAEVNGDVQARVSGVGKIGMENGRANLIRASVSGVGSVEYGGAARDLDASISGLGGVRVREVTGQVRKSVSGGGRVSIGDRSR
ncbi:MAG: hypothetical protein JNK30_01545 [Phenylobacterium sp.]|uniref:GIN domain-containing protein n=1 Tax=Phenylobacterium sp. TaxID=1871053 RepID=UPI001A5E6467|nr:DUF2807 domain-containing protein [Phenylobacterium sp.]MBL8770040.1 hypothetical protein [Phenylobacterium sp.]